MRIFSCPVFSQLLPALLLSVLLGACSAPYQAPVDEAGGTPRFLDTGRTHRVNGGETLYAVAWMYDLDFAALARANNLREPYTISPGQVLSVDLRGVPVSQQVAAAPNQAVTTPVVVSSGLQRSTLPSAPLQRQSLPPSEDPTSQNTPANVISREPLPAPTAVLPPVAPSVVAPATTTQPAASPPALATTPAPALTPPAAAMPPVSAPVDERPTELARMPEPAAPNAEISWDWPSRGNIIGRFTDSGMDNKGLDLSGNRGDPVLAAAAGEVVYAGSGLLRYGDLVILKHNERFLSAYAHNSAILVKEGERVTRGQKIAEIGSSGIDRNMLHFEIRLDGKPVDPLGYLPSR